MKNSILKEYMRSTDETQIIILWLLSLDKATQKEVCASVKTKTEAGADYFEALQSVFCEIHKNGATDPKALEV